MEEDFFIGALEEKDVGGFGGEVLTDHEAAFCGEVGVLDGVDLGDDFAIAGEASVEEVALVAGAPDVRSPAGDGVGARVKGGEAEADVTFESGGEIPALAGEIRAGEGFEGVAGAELSAKDGTCVVLADFDVVIEDGGLSGDREVEEVVAIDFRGESIFEEDEAVRGPEVDGGVGEWVLGVEGELRTAGHGDDSGGDVIGEDLAVGDGEFPVGGSHVDAGGLSAVEAEGGATEDELAGAEGEVCASAAASSGGAVVDEEVGIKRGVADNRAGGCGDAGRGVHPVGLLVDADAVSGGDPLEGVGLEGEGKGEEKEAEFHQRGERGSHSSENKGNRRIFTGTGRAGVSGWPRPSLG